MINDRTLATNPELIEIIEYNQHFRSHVIIKLIRSFCIIEKTSKIFEQSVPDNTATRL